MWLCNPKKVNHHNSIKLPMCPSHITPHVDCTRASCIWIHHKVVQKPTNSFLNLLSLSFSPSSSLTLKHLFFLLLPWCYTTISLPSKILLRQLFARHGELETNLCSFALKKRETRKRMMVMKERWGGLGEGERLNLQHQFGNWLLLTPTTAQGPLWAAGQLVTILFICPSWNIWNTFYGPHVISSARRVLQFDIHTICNGLQKRDSTTIYIN